MSWSEPGQDDAARALDVWPLDASNATLLDAVRPVRWPDPTAGDAVYDLIAIGAGAGGLVSAKQSGRRGARSAMISEHLAGGDCLNVGCVPSKALLHCARVAREARSAVQEGFLIGGAEPLRVDFAAVMKRMRSLRAKISAADSHTATVAAGADVYQGRGRFVGPHSIMVNGRTLHFKKAVVATGGRALVPDIPGLAEAPYMTNGTLFNLTALPKHLVVFGAGAVGLEMAQAFAAFGSSVTVLVRSSRVLSRESEEMAEAVQRALVADGVQFVNKVRVDQVLTHAVGGAGGTTGEAHDGDSDHQLPSLEVKFTQDCGPGCARCYSFTCDALLVATGRVPNVTDLGLGEAGIQFHPEEGIQVNDLGATSNADVFAVGDCVAGMPRFTHVAGEMAKLVVQNALFGDAWKLSKLLVPRCVYTDPEAASVGLTPEQAAVQGVPIDRYATQLEHNDRAILEDQAGAHGFVEIYCKKDTETIVGAAMVAPHAGDLISEVTLAMQSGAGLATLARVIHPYPTHAEAIMGCGLGYIRKHWQKLPPQPSKRARSKDNDEDHKPLA